ncbi:hypothetical protein MMSR116_15810 [Methylobacterium mesophilicum SR1.6/6]|uniref:Uncharacterized protein n=1 Tax=Methylobacterium mesophilicum SR1.6/6 TaxID=908290 RepID=A0A6B9FN87_9HYPH|nr:hypothetical protein [Methylobacterium mesophilicum]QGY03186.1 hypothetical protein MMSR116_15810 [Methylobacterium mesophilicum SR1.6/6]
MIPDDIRREVYGDPVEHEPTFADGGVLRRHTARKPGRCDGCPIGRGVQPGERYTVYVALTEHGFYSHRSCASRPAECQAADPPIERRRDPQGPCIPYDPDNLPF